MADFVKEVKKLEGAALTEAKALLAGAEAELAKLEGFKNEVSRLAHRLKFFLEHGTTEEIKAATAEHEAALAAHAANPVDPADRDAAAQKVLDLREQIAASEAK